MESGWEGILEKRVLFRGGRGALDLAAVARLSQKEEGGGWESSGRLL